MICFVNYLMKTLAKISNVDVKQVIKVSAHFETSGWGNPYLKVK